MQFLSSRATDGVQLKTGSSGYEWWYFDAWDERTEVSLVVIFYQGNPFSRRMFDRRSAMFKSPASGFPALSVSLHRKGVPLFIGFKEFTEAETQVGASSFQVGPNFFEQENGFWRIQLDFALPGGLQLRAKLRFEYGKDGWFHQPDATDAHGWNLASGHCTASGQAVVLSGGSVSHRVELKGNGYHDHNWGIRPLHRDFQSWSWARIHLEGATVVFYHKKLVTGVEAAFGWLCRDGSDTAEPVSITAARKKRSLFGLFSPRQFQLEGKGFRATLRHETVLESGPFYQRFISGTHAVLDGRSSFVHGISEFIQADRIHRRRFRPLLDMRITYPDRRPHWVQRISFLYKRTWL
jgi:carotenoid 1,2-hydratase